VSRKLPSGGEFSPNQIDLFWFLAAVDKANGVNAKEFIRERYFATSALTYDEPRRTVEQSKRAGNVLIGARTYGLLELNSDALTPLARAILAGGEPDGYAVFARDILRNRLGLEVLDCIRILKANGVRPGKQTIAEELRRRGIAVPTATTHHLILLKWLRCAGVLIGYDADDARMSQVLGASVLSVDDSRALSEYERHFLSALLRLNASDWLPTSQVVSHANTVLSAHLPEDRLHQLVLAPLAARGFLEHQRGTSGRGAKSGQVRATDAARDVGLDLIEGEAISPDVSRALRRDFRELLAALDSGETHVKGGALEHLVLRIAWLLNLRPSGWRLRSSQTGQAEVDLIAESAELIFSRWQIQCKNMRTPVSLEDIAKEHGLALLLKSHVIMFITRGSFGRDALAHAEHIRSETSLNVVLIGGDVLQRAAEGPAGLSHIVEALRVQALQTMQTKQRQLAVID
jgi:site-specific DNA-methyltransferase (cytosine-N4-specific)